MDTKTTVIAIVVALIVIAGGFLLLQNSSEVIAPEMPGLPTAGATPTYQNEEYGLSFQYPEGLYLHERKDAGTPERPQLSLFLVEDTEENRDVLEGRNTTPREGPIGITVDVYQNPEELSASEWVQDDTNWTVATSQAEPVTINGRQGVSFTWSGLYEGRTVVLTKGDKAYVFSSTWMSEEDWTLRDFDTIVGSLSL